MCVGSVCTQPAYSDKDHWSVFFLIVLNRFPFLKSSRSKMCDVIQTQAPPMIVD